MLNIMLAGAALGFAYTFVFPRIDAPLGYSTPRIPRAAAEIPPLEAPPSPNVNPLEFTVIADQNLFHPERKIPPEKKAEAPLPKPEFVLYGTLITSDLGIAYMDDKKATPVTTPGRGKRQTAVKKGEAFSGFVLKELQPDRVVMNRGEESLIVYLNDPQNPKAREVVAETGKPGSRPGLAATPRSTDAADPRPGPAAARPIPGVKPTPATTAAGLPASTPGVALPPVSGTSGSTGTSGTFTPARPRYRPLPPTPSTNPYPAPSPSTNPYPAPSPNRPYP